MLKSKPQSSFTLTSTKHGLNVISYAIKGESARDFRKPNDDVVFTSPVVSPKDSIFTTLPILPEELPVGCHVTDTSMFQCKVQLISTLPWTANSANNIKTTKGIVHLLTEKGKKIPLSLIGISSSPTRSKHEILKNINDMKKHYNGNVRIKLEDGKQCSSEAITLSHLLELVEQDAFTSSFLDSLLLYFPSWLYRYDKVRSTTFDLGSIFASPGLQTKSCSSFLNSPNTITFKTSSDETLGSSENDNGLCLAVDACTSEVSLRLPAQTTVPVSALQSNFRDLKGDGWEIEVVEAMFPGNSSKHLAMDVSLWNGTALVSQQTHDYQFAIKGTMSSTLQSKHEKVHFEYSGDAYVNTSYLPTDFHHWFKRPLTTTFNGKAGFTLTTMTFQQNINIDFPIQRAVGKCNFGGKQQNQRISFRLPDANDPFQNTPLAPLIRPEVNQPFYLLIQHGITGGQVVNIDNQNKYNIKTTFLSLLLSQLKFLLDNPQVGLVIPTRSLKRWRSNIIQAEAVLKDVRSFLFLPVSNYDIGKLLLLYNKLKQHVEKVRYLCSLLETAPALAGTVIITQLKQLTSNLPELPDLQFTRSPIIQVFKGFMLRFDGRICIQRLCFPSMPLLLDTSRTDKKRSQLDHDVVIQGEVLEDIKLSEVLLLEKHSKVALQIPRKGSLTYVQFNPRINFLGIDKKISATITNDTMTFRTSGLLFGKYQGTITTKTRLNVAHWHELKYHIKVTMSNDAHLPQTLKRKLNSYIQKLAAKGTERVTSAEQIAKEHRKRLQEFKKTIQKLNGIYAKCEKEKRRKDLVFKTAKIDYFSFKNSKIKDILTSSKDQTFCTPKPCSKLCPITEVCIFKSKKLEINETKYHCEVFTVEEERTEFVTRSAPSFYIRKTFIEVNTGNCGSRSGFVKFFAGCDNSYRSERGSDEKVSYTRVWQEEVRKRFQVKKHDCKTYIEKKVTNSFGPPEIVCNASGCVKVVDPNCTLQNIECIKRNKLIGRQNHRDSKFDQEKQRLVLWLQHLANKMEIASMELEKTKAKCSKTKEDLKLARSQMQHFEYAANRSSKVVREIKAFESTKLGHHLSTMLKTAPNKELISVSELKFDTIITKTKAKLPLSFNITSLDGKSKKMSFLFNFNNVEISLYKMMTTIVSTMFQETRPQQQGRPRRSISEQNEEEKAKEIEKSTQCFLARKVHSYYNSIVQSLKDIIVDRTKFLKSSEADAQKLQILKEKFENISQVQINENTTDNYQEITSNITDISQGLKENDTQSYQQLNGNNSKEIKISDIDNSQIMIQTCVDFLQTMLDSKMNHTLPPWNQSLIGWRAFLEVLTNQSSFQDCVSVQDCVTSLGEKLNELYFYESDYQPANEIGTLLKNVTNEIIELITNSFTEQESRNKLEILDQLLNKTYDINVLCGDRPKIISSSPEEQIILKNDTLVLKCVAISDSPVMYEWFHKNTTVQQSTNGTLIIANANFTHAGGYQCKAKNRKGFVTSNVTIITINDKPEITQHPRDTKAYINSGIGLLLWCNVTGIPFPLINWYFSSYRQNSTVSKLENDNRTSFYYKNITEEHSGFYFCEASNEYGQAQSSKASVWVLNMSPGEPRISVQVNVTRKCKDLQICQSSTNVEASREKTSFGEVLSASLNSTQKQVANLTYHQSGDFSKAVVSFTYKTSKPTRENNSDFSYDPFLESFARKRRDLSQGLQSLYHSMLNGSFSVATDSVELTGDAESLTAKFLPPGCPQGQEPHSNGYMCVSCLPGTYRALDDRKCKPCPVKTYQHLPGQSKCFLCNVGFSTKHTGSLALQDCYDMRPSPPKGLKVVAVGSTRLDVTWEKPEENSETVSHYLVRYSTVKSRRPYTAWSQKTATSLRLNGLRKFTDYRVVVYAVNRHGMKKSQTDIKTGEDIPDAGPFLNQTVPVSHNSIRVTWRPVPKYQLNGILRGHRIYYRLLRSDLYIQWKSYNCTQTGDSNTCVVPGLKPFTWYCVKMTVFTRKGEYPGWTNTNCREVKTPSPPINVTGLAVSSSSIRLIFRTTSDDSLSNVTYGERLDNLRYTKVCSISGCVLGDLKEKTLYYFKVVGMVKQIGELPSIIQVRTQSNDPTALRPVTGKALSSSQIQLRFYSIGERSIIVHYGQNLNYLRSGKECAETSCTFSGLKRDTMYHFSVFGLPGAKPTFTLQIRTKKRDK